MNQRGSAYVLALFCLMTVSAIALLWQEEVESYPDAVLRTWSGVVGDQAALSCMEYAHALSEAGKLSPGSRTVAVPSGRCKLTVTRSAGALVVRAEAVVRAGWGSQAAALERKFE